MRDRESETQRDGDRERGVGEREREEVRVNSFIENELLWVQCLWWFGRHLLWPDDHGRSSSVEIFVSSPMMHVINHLK